MPRKKKELSKKEFEKMREVSRMLMA